MDLTKLMKQAQEMQTKMKDFQEQLANAKIVGEAGAGMVKVEMTGRHDVLSVNIDPNIFNGPDDRSTVQDLVAAAFNDAVQKIEKLSKQKLSNFTDDMELPDGDK